jgi:hypothetical protein
MEIPAGSAARHGFGLTSESDKMRINRGYAILNKIKSTDSRSISVCAGFLNDDTGDLD